MLPVTAVRSHFDISEMLSHLEEKVRIKYFIEGQDRNEFERFDISFIEGSVSTPEQEEKVKKIRDVSEYVVTIGACSSSGDSVCKELLRLQRYSLFCLPKT